MPDLYTVTLIWPFMLWALAVLPLLVLAYALLHRKALFRSPTLQQAALAASTLQEDKHAPAAIGSRSGEHPSFGRSFGQSWRRWWSRHGVAVLMLLGITLAMLALTRPKAVLLMPGRLESVMLVIDSSGSMRANDVKPSRIEQAQAAARLFIDQQPASVKLGIVSASGSASVVQSPTDQRDALHRAVDRLALQTGTSLGGGIVMGLAGLLPASGLNVEKLLNPEGANASPNSGARALGGQTNAGTAGTTPDPKAAPQVKLEPGANSSAVMVLMTDGQSNVGPDPVKMAQVAADMGVRVFTIGFGTPEGAVLRAEGVQARVRLEEAALKKIAEVTQGQYFQAASAGDVQKIYASLKTRLVLRQHQTTEVTSLLLALSMGLVVLGAGVNVWRHGRVL